MIVCRMLSVVAVTVVDFLGAAWPVEGSVDQVCTASSEWAPLNVPEVTSTAEQRTAATGMTTSVQPSQVR